MRMVDSPTRNPESDDDCVFDFDAPSTLTDRVKTPAALITKLFFTIMHTHPCMLKGPEGALRIRDYEPNAIAVSVYEAAGVEDAGSMLLPVDNVSGRLNPDDHAVVLAPGAFFNKGVAKPCSIRAGR